MKCPDCKVECTYIKRAEIHQCYKCGKQFDSDDMERNDEV